ncbi:MAG: hypothetical protein WA970_19485, partial [Gammaproteobacteria bacterium]
VGSHFGVGQSPQLGADLFRQGGDVVEGVGGGIFGVFGNVGGIIDFRTSGERLWVSFWHGMGEKEKAASI